MIPAFLTPSQQAGITDPGYNSYRGYAAAAPAVALAAAAPGRYVYFPQ